VIAGAGGATAYGSVPANNPFLVKHVPYDPTMGQGIYGVISASATKLHVDTYMLKTGGKTIADDGAPVDTFDLSPRH
jgi:3-hydroxymyristoyl/3-hydroxydecanoyl-(acyl carrier protein) dehydratase